MEVDGDEVLLTHAVKVVDRVVSGLKDDLIVGVITAVFEAEEDGDDVIIPVIVLTEEIEGVCVFCKDEVTDTEPE